MLAFISDTGMAIAALAFIALFGASHIPKLARNLGEAGREFRKARTEFETTGPAETRSVPAVSATTGEDTITLTRAELADLVADKAARADSAS